MNLVVQRKYLDDAHFISTNGYLIIPSMRLNERIQFMIINYRPHFILGLLNNSQKTDNTLHKSLPIQPTSL